MTIEAASMLVASALAGGLFAIIYFGGLWLTVQRAYQVERPLFLFSVSFFARLALILVGFYYVFNGGIARLAACMLAFLITRQILIRWVQAAPERPERKEETHGN